MYQVYFIIAGLIFLLYAISLLIKDKKILYGFTGLLMLIAVFTNPTIEDHKSNLKQKIGQSLVSSLDFEDEPYSSLGKTFGVNLSNSLIDSVLSIDNYLLFSLAYINFENKKTLVSYGIMGNVYTTTNVDDVLNK